MDDNTVSGGVSLAGEIKERRREIREEARLTVFALAFMGVFMAVFFSMEARYLLPDKVRLVFAASVLLSLVFVLWNLLGRRPDGEDDLGTLEDYHRTQSLCNKLALLFGVFSVIILVVFTAI